MKQLIMALLIFNSCNTSKKILTGKELSISLKKTECSSYAVENNGELIGYVVKPFHVEMENKEGSIVEFETAVKANYADYYDRFYRTYWFIKNSAGDTTVDVVMLSRKQVTSVPSWQCEEQDVDTYKTNRMNLFDKSHPQFITYNLSRRRFKVIGDPD